MSNSLHEAARRELSFDWDFDLDYLTLARFAQLVVERGLQHIARSSWASDRMTLEGLFEHALTTLRDSTERAAVLDLESELGGGCVVHLSLTRGRVHLRVAAASVDTLAAARTWLQGRYPIAETAERTRVNVNFWAYDRRACRTTRGLEVPKWDEIEDNYPRSVGTSLSALMARRFGESESGA